MPYFDESMVEASSLGVASVGGWSWVVPIVPGSGKRLFRGGSSLRL